MEGRSTTPMTREERLVQLKAYPRGRGFVELRFEQQGEPIISAGPGSIVLHYPVSHSLIGEPPIDEGLAKIFNEALQGLNEALEKYNS